MKEARSKLYLWEMEQVKVTCSDGYSFLVKLFFFFLFECCRDAFRETTFESFCVQKFRIQIKECIPLSLKGSGYSFFKGTPKGRLTILSKIKRSPKWSLKLQIILCKVHPFFQKGTRFWSTVVSGPHVCIRFSGKS